MVIYKNLIIILLLPIFYYCNSIAAESKQNNGDSVNTKTYFYHNYGYGSDASFNPISSILNAGYYITLTGKGREKLNSLNYKLAAKNLFYNLSHPIENIKKIGLKEFISTEIFPLSFKKQTAQYVPNFTLHLVGCGSDYRALHEWYKAHNYRAPRVFTTLTYISGRVLNEVVENGNYSGPSVDAIADMYLFDILGVLLFQNDRIANFFSSTLNLANWSYQPMYGIRESTIDNVGYHYSVKWFPFKKRPVGIIVCTGINSSIGFSYRKTKEQCFSLGCGLSVKDVITTNEDDSIRVQTVETVWNVAFNYDKNNSLLASLIVAGGGGYRCLANIYPGFIPSKCLKPGIFFGLKQDWTPMFGLNCVFSPIGLAL